MPWNYLQIELGERNTLHPIIGPGGMSREHAHRFVERLLERYVEVVPATDVLEAWNSGPAEDTVYVDRFIWAIYEADDARAGAAAWIAGLEERLRASGSAFRVAW